MPSFICMIPVYEYKNWLFEYKPAIGAWPLKKERTKINRSIGATKTGITKMIRSIMSGKS